MFLLTFVAINRCNVMKKFILLLAVASYSMVSVAQEVDVTDPSEKHSVATNSFWANWFIQGAATWNAFYGVGEKSLVAPFHKFPSGEGHTGWGLSVSVGKWFTPGIGLRTKVNAWQMGSKMNGVKPDKYWTLNEQVLFNLTNLLLGYDEQRLWNFIPYAGAGINKNTTTGHRGTQFSMGLLNTFRLSNKFAANVELGWNNWEAGNTGLSLKKRFQQFTVEIGLTYRLGNSSWRRASDAEAKDALTEGELDALNAQLADAQAENARLQEALEAAQSQPKEFAPQVVSPAAVQSVQKKVISAPVSIFFDLGKAVVVTPRDRENVAALAKTASENNLKVVVTGYADSKTGTVEGNRRISEQRAQAVADQLVKLGVPRENITVVAAGGVDTLGVTENNRRVVVELKEN